MTRKAKLRIAEQVIAGNMHGPKHQVMVPDRFFYKEKRKKHGL